MKMENSVENKWENRLAETAAHFGYPPTPDISIDFDRQPVTQQQLAWRAVPTKLLAGALALFLILVAIAMTVPQVRAAVLDFLQIGAIQLLVSETPSAQQPTTAVTLFDLSGATTLEEAAGLVDFSVRLPTYPEGLGPPGHVFLQQSAEPGLDRQVLILVWQEPERPADAELSLSLIGLPFYGIKDVSLKILRETRVGSQPAYWIQGPHQLKLQDGSFKDWFFVSGNVLIWTEDNVTFRLESGFSMEESVRIAESLEPWSGN